MIDLKILHDDIALDCIHCTHLDYLHRFLHTTRYCYRNYSCHYYNSRSTSNNGSGSDVTAAGNDDRDSGNDDRKAGGSADYITRGKVCARGGSQSGARYHVKAR